MYTVEARIRGPPSYYSGYGNEIIRFGDDDIIITYEYSPTYTNGTTVHDGQIPTLIFRKL